MAGAWIPKHHSTWVTQHGSTLSGLDHYDFRRIGLLAHEVGDRMAHDQEYLLAQLDLQEKVGALAAGMNPQDILKMRGAVDRFIAIAAGHAPNSALCPSHPGHAGAVFSEPLYNDSGLAADLTKVCP